MKIQEFFDVPTSTLTYVVYDQTSRDAVVIDPVMDYDPIGSKVWSESVEEVADYIDAEKLRVRMILETHAHADHLSGSQLLKERYPDAEIAIGERITIVQEAFKGIFNLPEDFPTDGRQFDRLLKEGELVEAGTLSFRVLFTPGHTPACASYVFGESATGDPSDAAVFTGDTLFMPDAGTGRCDFPAGNAMDMYKSIHDGLYGLPDETRVFVGHDYQPNGRELLFETTVGAQKRENIQLKADTTLSEYVAFRTARDKTLAAPRLLFQSVQVNVDAGHLPEHEENERRYLKIPINVFRPVGSDAAARGGDADISAEDVDRAEPAPTSEG